MVAFQKLGKRGALSPLHFDDGVEVPIDQDPARDEIERQEVGTRKLLESECNRLIAPFQIVGFFVKTTQRKALSACINRIGQCKAATQSQW
ncbi:hypothetical protein [Xanthomonas euvesicatoria]|uniref:hypothetical protein n=1 Tax=Xanthomonas euvesicatoria TaxID=456327 RepID=UPI0030CA2192